MHEPNPEPSTARLNVRATIILAVIAILATLAVAVVHYRRASRLRPAAMAEARRLTDEGLPDQAVRNLQAFLEMSPRDSEAAEMESKLLAQTARSLEQLLNAATFNDWFVRTFPDAEGAQEARRRTADMYIRFGDRYLESSYHRNVPETTAFNMRHRAAAAVAQTLLDRGARDAGAYLLLARAKEQLAITGDPEMLDQSIRAYEQALEVDPDEVVAVEHLANLLVDRKHDKGRAVRLLDELARRRPDSARLRLARYRLFLKLGDDPRASSEMAAMIRYAPDDPWTCLEAAELDLRRGRTVEARRLVGKIPSGLLDHPRARLVRGLIEINDGKAGRAMTIWREGLASAQGADATLTWNLAFSLIQLGRLDEAAPLVSQYRRLIGVDDSPMLQLLLAAREQKSGRSLNAAHRLEALRERIDPRWGQLLDSTLGRCFADVGELTKSALAYRRVLHENPGAVAVRVELADVLTQARSREAIAVLEEGLRSSPDDPSLWVAMASARLREQEERPEASRAWESFDEAMARAIELAPSHRSLTTIRSRRQSLEGRSEDAEAMLEEAIARDPRDPRLWETYVEALLRAGRPFEALDVLDRAARPGAVGESVGIRLARFGVLRELGRAREAREHLAEGVDRLPPDQKAQIWNALSLDLASKGDIAGALAIYDRWAKEIPEDVRPRLILLEMAIHGAVEEARAASAALRRPGALDDEATLLDRARGLIRGEPEAGRPATSEESRFREAERLLEAARTLDPQSSAADSLEGELAERRGLTNEAARAYQRAWNRGSEGALPRLVDLLARDTPGELERLATMSRSSRLVRLASRAFLELGRPEWAARIAAAPPDASEPPEEGARRAELLERLGLADQAEARLRLESARRPESAEAWLAPLRLRARRGGPGAATSMLEEARRSVKDERPDFAEARLCRAAGDRDGADRAFRLALEARPDDIEILLAASDHEMEAGRPAGAESHLRRVLTLDRGHRQAARKLALLLASGPLDEAAWERARAVLGPEPAGLEAPEDRLARAILLSKAPGPDRRPKAVEALESLVVDLPVDIRAASTARTLLARLLLDLGRPDRAASLLKPRVDRGDDDPAELALYAEALLRTGRLDLVGAQLDRLTKVAPGDAQGPRLKARLIAAQAGPAGAPDALERALLAMGDSPAAVAFGREAFALIAAAKPPVDDDAGRLGRLVASKDPASSWMPALILGRHGQASEALRLCRVAVEAAGPSDARDAARVAFAAALGDAGFDHRAELEALLEAASRRDPDGTEIPLQVARLRHDQGRFEDAVRIYRGVMGRRPDLRASIQNNVAWILSEDLRRPEEALGMVDDLLQSGGRAADVLDTRGVILTRLGRAVEAVRDLEEATRAGADPVHLFHLARAYRAAGRLEDVARCRELLRRARLAPEQLEPSERADLASLIQP